MADGGSEDGLGALDGGKKKRKKSKRRRKQNGAPSFEGPDGREQSASSTPTAASSPEVLAMIDKLGSGRGTLSDRLNPTHPCFDADIKARWKSLPKKWRAAIVVADAARLQALAATVEHPFEADTADHCESPPEAYNDVVEMLDMLAGSAGAEWDPRSHPPARSTPARCPGPRPPTTSQARQRARHAGDLRPLLLRGCHEEAPRVPRVRKRISQGSFGAELALPQPPPPQLPARPHDLRLLNPRLDFYQV